MNSRTLKRGLRESGLRRRNEVHPEHEVREMIKREIEGFHHFLDIVRCGTSQEQATVLLSLETWSRFTRA